MNTCTNITPLFGLSAEAKEAISQDMSVFSVYDRPDYMTYDTPRGGVFPSTKKYGYQLGTEHHLFGLFISCPYEVAAHLQGQEQIDEIVRWASAFEAL